MPVPREFPEAYDFGVWWRWAAHTSHPARLLDHLKSAGLLNAHPEIAALDGVPQEPQYHPEGDVYRHTGLVMAAAVEIAEREKLDEGTRAILVLSALVHDFGKATMTRTILKDGQPYISSAGHEKASGPLAETFLRRIGADDATISQIVPLVENHMMHVPYLKGAGEAEVTVLAQELAPASVQLLAYLIEADTSGRPPLPKGLPTGGVKMVEAANRAGVLLHPPAKHPAAET